MKINIIRTSISSSEILISNCILAGAKGDADGGLGRRFAYSECLVLIMIYDDDDDDDLRPI